MTRVIRKSKIRSSVEVGELLRAVFSAEIAAPSRCLWLVSPWISDIQMLDNRGDTYDRLTSWGPRWVRLSEVLVTLASDGATIVIGTTSDRSNINFIQRTQMLFRDRALDDRLVIEVDESELLHEKAVTGDDFVINGSMNLTHNGLFLREEWLEFRTDEAFVARCRLDAYDRFGGVLSD